VRAFVALIPPPAALAELAAAVEPLRTAHPDLRWTPGAQWHLTLAFLGEVDERVLPDLTERLARAARRHEPMRLAFGAAGRFGNRVLWIRVDAVPGGLPGERESPVSPGRVPRSDRRADGLHRLAGSVTAAARRSGIAVDDRPYRPHLTLARAQDGADFRPLVAALGGFAGSSWGAEALHLVRSWLGAGPGGTAAHEIVGTWPLGR
jgi:2'-5' RNA ligase